MTSTRIIKMHLASKSIFVFVLHGLIDLALNCFFISMLQNGLYTNLKLGSFGVEIDTYFGYNSGSSMNKDDI